MHKILEELGVADRPILRVLNKVDRLTPKKDEISKAALTEAHHDDGRCWCRR